MVLWIVNVYVFAQRSAWTKFTQVVLRQVSDEGKDDRRYRQRRSSRMPSSKRGRKKNWRRQEMAYEVRECDDDDDPATLSCSLFQNRDLYAGQVLKFQALTRKLEFQRA